MPIALPPDLLAPVIDQLILLHDPYRPHLMIRSVVRLRLVSASFMREMRHPHHRFWDALLEAAVRLGGASYDTLRCAIGLCTMQPALVRSPESVDGFNRLIARGVPLALFLRRSGYDVAGARSARTGDTALTHAIRCRAIRAVLDLTDGGEIDEAIQSAIATLPESVRVSPRLFVNLRDLVRAALAPGGAVAVRFQLRLLMDRYGDDVFLGNRVRRRR